MFNADIFITKAPPRKIPFVEPYFSDPPQNLEGHPYRINFYSQASSKFGRLTSSPLNNISNFLKVVYHTFDSCTWFFLSTIILSFSVYISLFASYAVLNPTYAVMFLLEDLLITSWVETSKTGPDSLKTVRISKTEILSGKFLKERSLTPSSIKTHFLYWRR